MKSLYRLFFIYSLTAVWGLSFAQTPYDDELCLDKSVKDLKREDQKRRFEAGINKTLVVASYLNYSDRTVDRIITGKDEFEPHRGKIIRNIDVRVIDPYGVTIEKPEAEKFTRFQKFANGIQMSTKDWVVRNDILFKHGDAVNPILFADTERNLWDRRTFKDIKIFMVPVEGSKTLIDVVVMVQDRWSWSLNTSVQFNKIQAGIQFRNFLGLPQSISNYVSFNYRKDNFYTLDGNYQYENIRKSQINARVEYTYDNLQKGGKIEIRRKFFSATSRWAGHIKAGIYQENGTAENSLAASIPTNVFYNKQDLWLATAFRLPGRLGKKHELIRMILSGRMARNDYIRRPFMHSADGSQNFVNRVYFLGSIGFANWDYYLDHSAYRLDEAEYFSKGLNMALIMGFDYDEELQKRFYSGLEMDYGKYLGKVGYLNTRLTYGGFTKKNSYQQILFKISERFYSSPVKLGRKFMMRQFVSATLNFGFNRPLGRELVVNGNNGLRGIFVNYIRGDRNYVFNFETVVYPTFKILGFSSCAFVFADLAIVQQASASGFQLNQGYGAGIRLRNLKLGIDYFEISFAYYPDLNIPNLKPYSIMADFSNRREIKQNNLFEPAILSTDASYANF